MRGEGNHKIPGSFAPKNMKKTGAERVKCSLACQHEDAIPIKFVSYAQKCPTVLCTFAVALRKESVDRNIRLMPLIRFCPGSLSARRAWIEIGPLVVAPVLATVALRKESVDRNLSSRLVAGFRTTSLSARRAWIEIRNAETLSVLVWSLSARRAWIEMHPLVLILQKIGCRSPQGERG